MGYREMIKRVQVYSGFSDAESKDALQLAVESLSVHLTDGERKDFASQLPIELKGLALSVQPTEENSKESILRQFMEYHRIPEARAKKQLLSAWQALKDALSGGEIEHIKAQLPNSTVALLH